MNLLITDRVKRFVAFYFSVGVFCVLFPIILSYSLGYHIDYRELKVFKTGIISIKSQPAGASVFVNGASIAQETPARIEELKPGIYKVEVRREGFFPWQKDLAVRPNMVTKAEDIVLFPMTKSMKRLGTLDVVNFAVSDRGYLYSMAKDGLYRSSMDGGLAKRLSAHSNWPSDIRGKKFSPDGNKLLFFTEYRIWVVDLGADKTALRDPAQGAKVDEVLAAESPLVDVFWYSDSNYIVFVTEREIDVAEISGEGARNVVTLYTFSQKPSGLAYDETSDSLYFVDHGKRRGGKSDQALYRLDLRQKFFDTVMQRFKKEFDVRYEKR